jgi:uncharacterized protein YkwD
MSSRPRRLLAGLLLSGALFAVSVPMNPAEAAPRRITANQEEVRDLINNTRDGNRLRGLAMHQLFADRATLWARELARCQCLKHRPGPYGAPAGWCAAAENVGRGWSLAQVHRAFLGSPPHRANMLTPRFTHVGTGVVQDAGGEYFVVQAYMDRTC